MRLHALDRDDAMTEFKYREEYLQALVADLKPVFAEVGVPLPPVRVSCSFAYRGGSRVIGQCWPGKLAADGVAQIKITPLIDDAVVVAGIMVHELIHAARPGAGHRKPFRDIAIPIGLEGQMRTTVPGAQLEARLARITNALGPYPHARLDLPGFRVVRGGRVGDEVGPDDAPKKQSTRLIKVACPNCGYPARVTRMWLTGSGAPICPCGTGMVVSDSNPLAKEVAG